MKRSLGLLALALCLTACGGPADPAASAASTDAVQSNPARPAESEIILDDLPVGFEQVSAIGWCDFDRDGAEEEYKLLVQMDENSGMGTYHVSIGGSTAKGDAFAMEEKPYLVSIDGETVQLVLFDNGMSDDPMLHVFSWDGAAIAHAGTIYAAPADIELKNGAAIAPERFDILQNAWFEIEYGLADGEIVRQEDPEKWYDYIGQSELTTALQVKLFVEDDLTNTDAFTVPRGETVRITGVSLDREIANPSEGDMPMYWVRVEYVAAEKTGYLLANGYQCRQAGLAPVSADELFEDLVHAG